MLRKVRNIPFIRVRSRTLTNSLLFLCLLTLLGLFIAHQEEILCKCSQSLPATYSRYMEELPGNEEMLQNIDKQLPMEVYNDLLNSHRAAEAIILLNVTTKFPVAAIKPLKVTTFPVVAIKPLKVTTKRPVVVTEPLKVTTKRPVVATEPLKVTTKRPVVATEPLKVTTKLPAVATKPLKVTTKSPVVVTEPLKVTTKRPVVATEPLKVTTKRPVVATAPLKVTSKRPVVATKPLKVTTKRPVVVTEPLKVTTKRPVVATKPLKVTTKLPAVATKPLKVTTKHPAVATKPLKVTKLPAAATKSFNVTTLPPAVITKPVNETTKASAITIKSPLGPTKSKPISTTTSYLGDEYGWDDTHLNSSCPNRTRDKLRSPAFKEIFVETIPVLQWKKHATQAEYRRLQRYAGPYGWMGVTWHIVNETLSLLNSSNGGYMFDGWNRRAPCVRCAVVGNGGILNGSGVGEEIDGHDYVFRVNGAITKGHEEDVGNRTSFFFFSTNTLMNSLTAYKKNGFQQVPRTEETRFLLLPDHDRDYLLVRAALTNSTVDRGKDKSKRPSKYFGQNLTTEHFKILHPDFMRYLRNRFLWSPILNTRSRDIYRPTTGASMMLAAVHTCDQVSAYGFITPNYAKYSDHYFDQIYKKVVFYSNHNFRKEIVLWQQLHAAGVIKLYMRD